MYQAVSTASAFSDRVCIASKGKFRIPLSDNNLCGCEKNSYGCSGGYMDTAHAYLSETGLITGGKYESDIVCRLTYFEIVFFPFFSIDHSVQRSKI